MQLGLAALHCLVGRPGASSVLRVCRRCCPPVAGRRPGYTGGGIAESLAVSQRVAVGGFERVAAAGQHQRCLQEHGRLCWYWQHVTNGLWRASSWHVTRSHDQTVETQQHSMPLQHSMHVKVAAWDCPAVSKEHTKDKQLWLRSIANV